MTSDLGLWEAEDDFDRRLARGATGVLAAANRAGLLTAAEVLVAERLGQLAGETDAEVLLAVACAVHALGRGSVCVDLDRVSEWAPELVWPEPAGWLRRVADSPLVERGAVVVDEGLVYLDRYHRLELQVHDDLRARRAAPPPPVGAAPGAALDRAFPRPGSAEQRAAAGRAVAQWTTVLTGGPGTGKTSTVAGLLAVLTGEAEVRGSRLSIALTAPTGKAAARLQESVIAETRELDAAVQRRLAGLTASTLHRLLGWRPDNSTRFRHHRGNRLSHDVVVVDEASMVDLQLMARLLEALRPETRLVLVGDPDQLTSVGAGAVLSDLVHGSAGRADSPVVALTTSHRFTAEIGALATALRQGDADAALAALRAGGESVEFVEVASDEEVTAALKPLLLAHLVDVMARAESGDTEGALRALDRHRLMCAHRDGPRGVGHWNRRAERWLAEAAGVDHWPRWYVGRPLLVTHNDYTLGVYNGETGVVVRRPSDGALRGVINGSSSLRDFATTRLGEVDTMHALTVHKSQGSQAREVTVLLPAEDSRLLSRELFYTAVTRAQEKVRIVGSEAEVRAAIARRAERATGLRQRLAASD